MVVVVNEETVVVPMVGVRADMEAVTIATATRRRHTFPPPPLDDDINSNDNDNIDFNFVVKMDHPLYL
jgi:hypothetical protein